MLANAALNMTTAGRERVREEKCWEVAVPLPGKANFGGRST